MENTMIRNRVATLSAVACLGLGLGCGDESTDPLSVVGPGPTAAPAQALAGPIDLDQAEQIALAAVPGEVVGTETETEDDRELIEVEIQTADGLKSVEIDAATGEIVDIEDEDVDDTDEDEDVEGEDTDDDDAEGEDADDDDAEEVAAVGVAFAAAQGLAGAAGIEEAVQIALAAVPGDVIETESEMEHGREVIEVEIQTADGVVSVEVDAATGEILEIEEEEQDDEDDEDQDDDEEDDALDAEADGEDEDEAA